MIYFDSDRNAYGFEIDNYIYKCDDALWADFQQNPDKYIWNNNEIILNPDYETKLALKEQERINNLTMTALDFIGVLESFGLSLEQINAYLEANLSIKMQLTYCQNVFCGVAKSLMPITFENITITADMVEVAFRIKNGETVEETGNSDIEGDEE